MLGAIAGDFIGSRFEGNPVKTKEFELITPECRFTDDTVLTVAVADSLLHRKPYAQTLQEYFRRYPGAGYGASFLSWAASESAEPYNSFGNGSAMRVSPVGWLKDDEADMLREAQASASVTHNHPEGIKGAQAVALAVFLARTGGDKALIKRRIESRFGYDLSRTADGVRPGYRFDVTCQGSVPEALVCFLGATDFEDAVRTAVSLGGDSDTQACIAGAVAEAYFGGVPGSLADSVLQGLDEHLRSMVREFRRVIGETSRLD
jgi:ADP-ribosylglycohydrolase